MATQTTNLNLVKPDYTDAADIAVINSNMDIVDSNVHGNAVNIAGIATIITGTTNNSGHSVSSGEYFIANGAKYKATAAIGTGVTWADKSSSVSDHDLINALNTKINEINIKRIYYRYLGTNDVTETVTLEAGAYLVMIIAYGANRSGMWMVASASDSTMVNAIKVFDSEHYNVVSNQPGKITFVIPQYAYAIIYKLS